MSVEAIIGTAILVGAPLVFGYARYRGNYRQLIEHETEKRTQIQQQVNQNRHDIDLAFLRIRELDDKHSQADKTLSEIQTDIKHILSIIDRLASQMETRWRRRDDG